jgi:hypothetical protein
MTQPSLWSGQRPIEAHFAGNTHQGVPVNIVQFEWLPLHGQKCKGSYRGEFRAANLGFGAPVMRKKRQNPHWASQKPLIFNEKTL